MVIILTSLRLRSLFGYFKLSWMGFNITLQTRKQKGFLQIKNTGLGYTHYTLSAWQTEEDAKAFAHSGYHLKAMKQSAALATEIRIYKYSGETLPKWGEVKTLLSENAKVYTYK